MAVDRGLNPSDRASTSVEPEAGTFDRDAGHSNYIAFLLGASMLSIGLLAFVLFDRGAPNTSLDVTTTGSIRSQFERPAPAPPTARP